MKLHIYFARKFAVTFFGVFCVFFGIMSLLDIVDQLRRFDGSDISFGGASVLALLSVPETIYRILPLVVLLATLALFLGLARSSELVVTRAAGRSALRALIAPVLTALVIGMLGITVMNPIVAATQQQYEIRAQHYRDGEVRVLSISEEGLWLRQGDAQGQSVIRAERANLDGSVFFNVTFLDFDSEGHPVRRIEAASAALMPFSWVLKDAKVWPLRGVLNPEKMAKTYDTLDVPASLTTDQIRDSFGTRSSIPIWELPAFIDSLDRAGFSTRNHRVWLQMELGMPAFLVAMVMIGAAFTMRHTRFGHTGQMVLLALGIGLGVYFIRNFAQILGENGQIPIFLAAWSPPLAGIFMALGLLLHLEDG
jgi:lipopolysaccharide export system permease protein